MPEGYCKFQNWTFRQHRFSWHHQQYKQGSTKLKGFCTALLTLLMMTAESMLPKRAVLRFTGVIFPPQAIFVSSLLYSKKKKNCMELVQSANAEYRLSAGPDLDNERP